MSIESRIPHALQQYGLVHSSFSVRAIGSGYIHHTFKVEGSASFILQRINKHVFKEPEVIAANIEYASRHLRKHHPDFLFTTPLKTIDGKNMAWDNEGFPWRLFPYIENSFTIDKVNNRDEAYSAAVEFGRLTKNLQGADIHLFKPTIQRFHDLAWRFEQFEQALKHGTAERKERARNEIEKALGFRSLVDQYMDLISSNILKLRLTHNDTKINNILFDSKTGKALCAIDLDTLMPGYFIYDLGDMVRTFVSPVDEDETDISKIRVRLDIHRALVEGYLAEMGTVLTAGERQAIPFSGKMMTYIMALRFLADFLNGDIYYQVKHADHNLDRAKNQLQLLSLLGDIK